MAALVRVILSTRVAWAVENEAEIIENEWTASMIVRKSLVEMVMYY